MERKAQQRLAEGLHAGSREAWQQLYDAYAVRVWRGVSRLMGRDSSAVADVVQEVFLAAAATAGKLDIRRGTLWPWLWGIARHQVFLHYRRRRAREELGQARQWWASLDGERADWLAAEADAPDEVLQSRELADLVRQALAQLPAEYQILLASKYLDGASVSRIAGELNRSPTAIRSKLARARRAFRRTFLRMTR